MMKETHPDGIIITGGRIHPDWTREYLSRFDQSRLEIIAADRGLLFCEEAGVLPAHIVGDFDSAGAERVRAYEGREDVTLHRFPPEKDWTDTELALELALSLGWKTIIILGGTGTRVDHMFGNLQLLALARERGADCFLVDPWNRISLRTRPFTLARADQWGDYISVFAFGGDVTGLTMKGVRYEVVDLQVTASGTRTLSNEITAPLAEFSWQDGMLLVVESKDE